MDGTVCLPPKETQLESLKELYKSNEVKIFSLTRELERKFDSSLLNIALRELIKLKDEEIQIIVNAISSGATINEVKNLLYIQ